MWPPKCHAKVASLTIEGLDISKLGTQNPCLFDPSRESYLWESTIELLGYQSASSDVDQIISTWNYISLYEEPPMNILHIWLIVHSNFNTKF